MRWLWNLICCWQVFRIQKDTIISTPFYNQSRPFHHLHYNTERKANPLSSKKSLKNNFPVNFLQLSYKRIPRRHKKVFIQFTTTENSPFSMKHKNKFINFTYNKKKKASTSLSGSERKLCKKKKEKPSKTMKNHNRYIFIVSR